MTKTTSEMYPTEQIPEHLRESGGFVVHFPSDRQIYADLYASLPLKQNLKTFLQDVFGLLSKKEADFCSFKEITDHLISLNKSSGKTMIYERTKNLSDAGILTEHFFKPNEALRRVKLYIVNQPIVDTSEIDSSLLEKPSPNNALAKKDSRGEAEKKQLLLKSSFGDQMLDTLENRSYRDAMMSTMLAKCIRLDSSDDRKMLVTHFDYKNSPIDVTTTTQTNGNIAVSGDIRYTMVFSTFCMDIMTEYLNKYQEVNKKPENLFIIDLSEVATHIGNKRTTGNRLTAYKAAKRLYQTNFEIITPEESEFAERFLEGYNEANYRFLTDFRAIVQKVDETDDLFSDDEEIVTDDIKNPRWIRISLWPASFDNMWSQVVNKFQQFGPLKHINHFAQNPEVVKNKSPIAYHLYAHLASWVGVSGNNKRQCNTSDLHAYMLPNSRYQNFVRDILNLFNGLRAEEEKKISNNSKSFEVNFYGYIVEGRQLSAVEKRKLHPRKGLHLTFHRDVSDRYIGNNSKHHQLKASTDKSQTEIKPDTNYRKQFLETKDELGKEPDDIDIPKSSYFVANDKGSAVLQEYDMFEQGNGTTFTNDSNR